MEWLFIREAVLLLALAIAAYTDWKTGLIYDWLTYGLIGAGIVLNVFEFSVYGIWPFAIAIAVFATGYAFYHFGKLGGGDVKLFAGIALTLPYWNGTVFVLPLLFYSALSAATVLGVYYGIQYYRKGIDWKLNEKSVQRAAVFGIVFIAYLAVAKYYRILPDYVVFSVIVPLMVSLFFFAFEKGIRETFFLKQIPLKQAEEDEILALEKLSDKQYKAVQGKTLLEEKGKAKLKSLNVSHIWVYRDLPKFAPFILLAALLLLAFPQLGALFSLVR